MSTWYWQSAQHSQPQGPITPIELKNLALSNQLGRNDFVWKQGMKDWVKAYQLKGLFDAPPTSPTSSQAQSPPTETAQTPNARLNHTADTDRASESAKEENAPLYEANPTFLSYRGRLRRTNYFLQSLAIAFPVALINAASGNSPEAAGIMAIFWLIASVLLSFPYVKRLHDLNLSGGFYWVCLIPLVNIIFGLYVLFARGTQGQNKYGPDPRV